LVLQASCTLDRSSLSMLVQRSIMMGICTEKGNPGLTVSVTLMVIPVNVQSEYRRLNQSDSRELPILKKPSKIPTSKINNKNLRGEQAGNSHRYQLCENIIEEIGVLKQKRYELNTELKLLKRKQQQAAWYKKTSKRKQQSDSETNMSPSTSEQESCTSTAYPSSSSRSRSSTPGLDFPGTDHMAPEK